MLSFVGYRRQLLRRREVYVGVYRVGRIRGLVDIEVSGLFEMLDKE